MIHRQCHRRRTAYCTHAPLNPNFVYGYPSLRSLESGWGLAGAKHEEKRGENQQFHAQPQH